MERARLMKSTNILRETEIMKPVVYSAESPLKQPQRLMADFFREVVSLRELIWALFVRDLKARYRQSFFGYFWILAPVIGTTAVWFYLNSQGIVEIDESEIPYPVFVLVGQVLWGAFAAALLMPLSSFNASRSVTMKLKVAPEAFIISALGKVFFDLFVRVLFVFPILLAFGIGLSWESLLFFPILLALCWIGVAVGLFFVPLGSLFQDVGQALGMVVPFLMYLSPVVYPTPQAGFAAELMDWNPLAPFINVGRDCLTLGDAEGWGSLLLITMLAVILSVFGFLIVRIVRPRLIERMGM